MVLHEVEDVVVDVAEEAHFRLHPPVVAVLGERGVLVKESAVPPAHLVVGEQVGVLHVLLFEEIGRFFEEVHVDPGGDFPVFFRDDLVPDLGRGLSGGAHFEFFGKGLVIEKGPRVVEFGVESAFEVRHRLYEFVEFRVTD